MNKNFDNMKYVARVIYIWTTSWERNWAISINIFVMYLPVDLANLPLMI